jgi:hypothetical protein
LTSFTTLALTACPKFSSSDISIAFVSLIGGIENLRSIHHAAAIVICSVIWHLLGLWLTSAGHA